jgi:hypothetical protein
VLSPGRGIPVRLTSQDGRFDDSRARVTGNIHEMVELRN